MDGHGVPSDPSLGHLAGSKVENHDVAATTATQGQPSTQQHTTHSSEYPETNVIMVDAPHDMLLEVDMADHDSAIGDVTTSYEFHFRTSSSQHYDVGESYSPTTSSTGSIVSLSRRAFSDSSKKTEEPTTVTRKDTEQERLDLQHQLFLLTFGNKLHLAPTEELHQVLDIGTGTGIWCIEFALRNPQSHVTGTDLSPIQPELTPPNCTFEVDDAEDEWVFPHQFDLVHGRTLASCFKDPQKVINSATASIKPGGWLEFQDIILPARGFDDSYTGSYVDQWCTKLVALAARAGRDFSYSQHYRQMFQAAGLVDIQERHFVWPTSPWCKGEHLKKLSLWAQKDFLDGIEGMSMALMTRVGGMSREEVLEFLEKVKEDARNKNMHGFMPIIVVMGRKAS
ncbi:S-adenosyl-L-methionine-dependent methyltransferase [Zalerion maritima]|uniref:S-adenosyl-L-methionine-dependent methyltransferase n=1 Tax=Zalerion maritima TaxID=339359 RepID=A0AAD5WTK5_9PEZI|nr:S-adenosyl-L-methionine-dependent methyltransferase [Zalerion maritima]